jgi:plasmid maintenance system killer protein
LAWGWEPLRNRARQQAVYRKPGGRHAYPKGLEELHLAGKTRRIGESHIRKCARILQLLDVAEQPQDMDISGFRFHGLQGNPKRCLCA